MSDHLVVIVDQLDHPVVPVDQQPPHLPSDPSPSPSPTTADAGSSGSGSVVDRDGDDEEEPLIQMVECRICQEEDSVSNLETPCACSGSLKVSNFCLSSFSFSLIFL